MRAGCDSAIEGAHNPEGEIHTVAVALEQAEERNALKKEEKSQSYKPERGGDSRSDGIKVTGSRSNPLPSGEGTKRCEINRLIR